MKSRIKNIIINYEIDDNGLISLLVNIEYLDNSNKLKRCIL